MCYNGTAYAPDRLTKTRASCVAMPKENRHKAVAIVRSRHELIIMSLFDEPLNKPTAFKQR